MKKLFITIVIGLVFIMFLAGTAFALEGMVLKITDAGIVINRGSNAGIQPETTLYITRMGESVGTVKVIQVDDYSTVCQVVDTAQGKQISVGDLFNTEAPANAGAPSAEKSPVPPLINENINLKEKTEEEIKKEEQKTASEYEKSVNKQFADTTKKKTQVIAFKRGAGGTVKIDPLDAYNLFSTIVTVATPYHSFNIWHGMSSSYQLYASYKGSQNPNRIRHVQIEVTLWDSEYLDAFASYYAYKETVTDSRKINVIKDNIYREKGIDKFYVFQVKILNPGSGAIQFAPFPWHFYLKGPDKQRIKADHYDEILDKALNTDQVVNGYVYFAKNDENGQPILAPGSAIRVELSDILGNSREVSFSDGSQKQDEDQEKQEK